MSNYLPPETSVQLLERDKIDSKQWNHCIDSASNGLIYGTTTYLDAMADNWCGIVVDNYDWVMPLIWRKKYFVTYLYQPSFLQQVGLFGNATLSSKLLTEIETTIQSNFKYAAVNLNLEASSLFSSEQLKTCANYVISLQKSYAEIATDYKNGFSKNVKRAQQFRFRYVNSDGHKSVVALYKQLYGSRFPHVSTGDYQNFEKLCSRLSESNSLFIRHAVNANNELGAAAIFFKDAKRIYNIMSCTTGIGRETEANYFLYDQLIKEFAGQDLLLDLEGSDIKGIADFYTSMGAINQPYFFITYNHLPWPLRLLK